MRCVTSGGSGEPDAARSKTRTSIDNRTGARVVAHAFMDACRDGTDGACNDARSRRDACAIRDSAPSAHYHARPGNRHRGNPTHGKRVVPETFQPMPEIIGC